jgi:hypothetical protein
VSDALTNRPTERKLRFEMHSAVRQRQQSSGAPAKRPARPAQAPSMSEEILDTAIEFTFPASDPISVVNAFRMREREESEHGGTTDPA